VLPAWRVLGRLGTLYLLSSPAQAVWVLLKGSNEPSDWWKCRYAVFMGMVTYATEPRPRM
jgi:hypothetical protein